MSVEKLSMLAGALLSLLFAYVPGLSGWFDKLDSVYKRLIMAASLLIVAFGVFGLSCAGLLDLASCDKLGAFDVLNMVILAMVANQGAYQLLVKKSDC